MTLKPCRECEREVSTEAIACPHCGAPYPTQSHWKGPGFEWRSETTLWGYPLVHIAFGRNGRGGLRVAKGIVAIGQFGIGAIAIAQFGIGFLFSFGQVTFGAIAIAQVAAGVLFGMGQVATGYEAIGQWTFDRSSWSAIESNFPIKFIDNSTNLFDPVSATSTNFNLVNTTPNSRSLFAYDSDLSRIPRRNFNDDFFSPPSH
jgi:hypothetical protein